MMGDGMRDGLGLAVMFAAMMGLFTLAVGSAGVIVVGLAKAVL